MLRGQTVRYGAMKEDWTWGADGYGWCSLHPLPGTKTGEDVAVEIEAYGPVRQFRVKVLGGFHDPDDPDKADWAHSFSVPWAELPALHAFIGKALAAAEKEATHG